MLYKPWVTGLLQNQQLHYQYVNDCTYWPVIGSFNNYNIITLSHKSTTSESIEEIHQVEIEGINNNNTLLF